MRMLWQNSFHRNTQPETEMSTYQITLPNGRREYIVASSRQAAVYKFTRVREAAAIAIGMIASIKKVG